MKYLKFSLIYLVALFFSACCSTVPPGQVEGPIVNDPTDTNDTIMNGEMALNHMAISLVMKCPAITNAGKDKPKVINDFVVSHSNVNYLQMKVWRSLINMNMIKPVFDKKENPAFELESEISKLSEKDNGKIKYSWMMSMKKIADKKVIWTEKINFTE